MKRALLTLLLAGAALAVSSCVFMGSDDREFFGKGWTNPKELDTDTTTRSVPNRPPPPGVAEDAAPTTTLPTASSPSSASSTDLGGEWATPKPR